MDILCSLKENFSVGFFSDITTARSFKLCMFITSLGVYIVMVGLVTLDLFQGHRCVWNINCKLRIFDSCLLLFKRCMVATYIKKIMHVNMISITGVYSREIINVLWVGQVSVCGKNFNDVISWTWWNISVELCMMVVLTELYPFLSLSVTLIVFQRHSSV